MRSDSSSRSPVKTAPLVFGRYHAIAKIGEGGAGQVFLARAKGEAGFERLFALKVIGWRGDQDRVGLTLQHEMRIASQVHHRNVVGVLDFGSYSDGYYLVMEYVEGATLSELQHRQKDERPPRLIVPIIIDALYGLHAAHSIKDEAGASAQFVHRDVSPQNLLVGVDGACRVTDFGIARARNMMHTTRPNVVRGKPAYMSPEQIVGGELDRRSDLFSTGIVLWNALTGKKLFHGPSEHVSMFNVLKRKVPKPSTVGLKPPAFLDALVLKALEREPDRRFQSAEEMATAMRDAAMRAGSLGAPTDIARWVGQSFGPELEARRRTVREASEQAKVVRIDGDRTSLAAFGSVLPRLEGPSRAGATDSVERLTVEDLSLASDEVEDIGSMAAPEEPHDARTFESARTPAKRRSIRLWGLVVAGVVTLAAIIVLVRWWAGGSDVRAVEPTAARARPSEPLPTPALEVPRLEAAPSIPVPAPTPPSTTPQASAEPAPEAASGGTAVTLDKAEPGAPTDSADQRPTDRDRAPVRTTRRAVPVRAQRSAADAPRRGDEPAAARTEAPAEPQSAPPSDKAENRHLLETNPYLLK